MKTFTIRASLALGIVVAPLSADAQQSAKVYRIGLLDYSSPDSARVAWWEAFRQRLRELDYREGRNITFEPRWARGKATGSPASRPSWSASRLTLL